MAALDISRVQNLTTGIDIKMVELIEFGERTLVFQGAARALPAQLVAIKGVVTLGSERHPFEAVGKIQSFLEGADKLNRFEITLQQFDRELWARLVETLKAKQTRADRIFTSIRGEDT